jgi:hypothetical protein
MRSQTPILRATHRHERQGKILLGVFRLVNGLHNESGVYLTTIILKTLKFNFYFFRQNKSTMEEKSNPLGRQTQNPDNLAIILASHIFFR